MEERGPPGRRPGLRAWKPWPKMREEICSACGGGGGDRDKAAEGEHRTADRTGGGGRRGPEPPRGRAITVLRPHRVAKGTQVVLEALPGSLLELWGGTGRG